MEGREWGQIGVSRIDEEDRDGRYRSEHRRKKRDEAILMEERREPPNLERTTEGFESLLTLMEERPNLFLVKTHSIKSLGHVNISTSDSGFFFKQIASSSPRHLFTISLIHHSNSKGFTKVFGELHKVFLLSRSRTRFLSSRGRFMQDRVK